MTSILTALLAVNAVLHGVIIARFGVKGNEPPLAFGVAYAALAVAVFFAVPYALWATLIVSVVAVAGLTAAYAKIPHEKSIERVCWAVGAIIFTLTAFLLFLR
ncbi:hypothetical protein ACRDNQ_18345 [Palleronia sp. KMU-117]|uniref:hypothetical protein n=1 Tax=Palleronia sp. KMU-117 TaxID=3434108 RepID=UPI003D71F708